MRRRLEDVDARLASLVVPYEEWEVLYRQRLQVERDLLRVEFEVRGLRAQPGQPDGVVERVGRAVEALVGD